jgi:KaiC/GvpD/RAD55 family RecA-like ATPase
LGLSNIESKPPNLYQLPSIDNLSDHTLSLSLAIKDARAKEKSGKMLLVLDTLSNIILRHKALTTTRWLTDFLGKRKAEGFTIVATLNPLTISKEEVQTVVDFFDGVIEIFERELKERSRRFLIVKKMYGKKYSESELMLDKDELF